MRFDVELSDRLVDLVDEGFDAAVRIGSIGGVNLVGRRVGSTALVCCAAPAYLARHGEPAGAGRARCAHCLTYAYAPQTGQWPFRDAAGARAQRARQRPRAREQRQLPRRDSRARAWGSPTSPTSWSAPTFARAVSCRSCERSRRRPRESTSSIRAGGTCRPRCALSRTSCPALHRRRVVACCSVARRAPPRLPSEAVSAARRRPQPATVCVPHLGGADAEASRAGRALDVDHAGHSRGRRSRPSRSRRARRRSSPSSPRVSAAPCSQRSTTPKSSRTGSASRSARSCSRSR